MAARRRFAIDLRTPGFRDQQEPTELSPQRKTLIHRYMMIGATLVFAIIWALGRAKNRACSLLLLLLATIAFLGAL